MRFLWSAYTEGCAYRRGTVRVAERMNSTGISKDEISHSIVDERYVIRVLFLRRVLSEVRRLNEDLKNLFCADVLSSFSIQIPQDIMFKSDLSTNEQESLVSSAMNPVYVDCGGVQITLIFLNSFFSREVAFNIHHRIPHSASSSLLTNTSLSCHYACDAPFCLSALEGCGCSMCSQVPSAIIPSELLQKPALIFRLEIYDSYPFERPLIVPLYVSKFLAISSSTLESLLKCQTEQNFTDPFLAKSSVFSAASKFTNNFVLKDDQITSITIPGLIRKLTEFLLINIRLNSRIATCENFKISKQINIGYAEDYRSNVNIVQRKSSIIVDGFSEFINSSTNCRGMFVLIFLLSILIRVGMGLGGYSGRGNKESNYGDYEAHRNWMSTTHSRNINEWYIDNQWNHMNHWKIDYPPLAAYHAYILGHLSYMFDKNSLVFFNQGETGYEDSFHKFFMRLSVIISDTIFFFPSAFYFTYKMCLNETVEKRKLIMLTWLMVILTGAPFILIDHGHFQYNCVSLGLLLWSICFILRGNLLLAAAAYTGSVLSKQTMLYFAPSFLSFFLGVSVKCAELKGIMLYNITVNVNAC